MKDVDRLSIELDLDNKEDDQSVDSVDIFPHQVGGHHLIVKHPSRPDLIVKPFFKKETRFYEDAKKDPLLSLVISKYFGEIHLPLMGGNIRPGKSDCLVDCIVLEDLTFGMDEPCILDMKIGRRLYDDDATPEKRERMKLKSENSTSSASMDPKGSIVLRLKKDVRGLTKVDLLPMMEAFFALLAPEAAIALLGCFIQRLDSIRIAVESSNGHFYSSSILFVYDHRDITRWDCRMIDFVHCTILPKGETTLDSNYMEGLEGLVAYFKRVQQRLQPLSLNTD